MPKLPNHGLLWWHSSQFSGNFCVSFELSLLRAIKSLSQASNAKNVLDHGSPSNVPRRYETGHRIYKINAGSHLDNV
jgi:hypothetical protein